MFDRTYYATHPDMMECVSNEELRDRYLVQDLFREGECVLNYTHADRFVIGGVAVGAGEVHLPDQTEPPSAAGHPFLERRELAIVNVGSVDGTVTVDGEVFALGNKDCLYVTMGAVDVEFSGTGARFYIASCPAHKGFTTRKLGIADANALEAQKYDIVTIAAVADDVPMLKVALEGGCKAGNITSPYYGTALIAAAHLGHDEVVRTLIAAKAPLNHVNNLGWTALMEAVVLGNGGANHTATVRALVEAGADLNKPDRQGTTPLQHARRRAYVEMARILENAGAR